MDKNYEKKTPKLTKNPKLLISDPIKIKYFLYVQKLYQKMSPSLFEILPNFLLTHLLTFLPPSSIFHTLPLTCQFFFQLISTSSFLRLHIPLRSFGISLQNIKTICQLSDSEIESIFLSKLQNFRFISHQELPFYGFYSDGGVDSDSPEYWVDTLFLKGTWSICTRMGSNFHVKGVLDHHFNEAKKGLDIFNALNEDFRQSFLEIKLNPAEDHDLLEKFSANFVIDALEEEQQRTYLGIEEDSLGSDEEYFPSEKQNKNMNQGKKTIRKGRKNVKKRRNDYTRFQVIWDTLTRRENENSRKWVWRDFSRTELLEKLAPSIDLLRKSHVKWERVKKSDNMEIYEKMETIQNDYYAIVKGFEISRKGIFSCPVKTCMVFMADFDVDVKKISIFEIFKEAKSAHDILSIYEKHGDNLPSIYHTNCSELSQRTMTKSKPIHCDPTIARFVIFNNSEHKLTGEARPVAWLQFLNKDLKVLKVKLDDGRLFGGRHVVVKLIDCENRMAEFGESSPNPNIDLNYVSLFGDVVELSKSE